jgi:hypothetical protein
MTIVKAREAASVKVDTRHLFFKLNDGRHTSSFPLDFRITSSLSDYSRNPLILLHRLFSYNWKIWLVINVLRFSNIESPTDC